MATYYCAIDIQNKLKISPPLQFSIKCPGIFHPTSPFPNMVMMKNAYGYNFTLVNDGGIMDDIYYMDGLIDITDATYAEYLKQFPWAKEIYETNQEKT